MVAVGNNIEKIRAAKNLDARQVAQQLNLSENVYLQLEQAHPEISYRRLAKISNVLDTNASEIVQLQPDDTKMFAANLLLAQLENKRWQRQLLRDIT